MLFEKMNAAMRHSAEEGKKRRELDAQKNGGMRAELERGDVCAMLISAFLTIVPVVGGAGAADGAGRLCRGDSLKKSPTLPEGCRIFTAGAHAADLHHEKGGRYP